jgi:hypothetical protein
MISSSISAFNTARNSLVQKAENEILGRFFVFHQGKPGERARTIRERTTALLINQKHAEVERLFNVFLDNGRNDIVYEMCDAASYGAHTSDEQRVHWAEMIKRKQGTQRVESYARSNFDRMKTNRGLANYAKYLDISNDDFFNLEKNAQIMVIGGGKSPLQSQIDQYRRDISIVNIDPVYNELNSKNEKEKVGCNFYDNKISDMINSKRNFNEIWSCYALPIYASSPREVKDFYHRSVLSLKKGGVLRVFPIRVAATIDFGDGARVLNKSPLKGSLRNIIDMMADRRDLFQIDFHETEIGTPVGYKRRPCEGATITLVGNTPDINKFFNEINLSDLIKEG